ncbi:DUF45 domain-containing protein [Nostoc sp. B(2019)]|nr:DUF45 domain-containing protein [Nostoc sp. B(2019)]
MASRAHHGDTFWEVLGNVMPDWRARKSSLEFWEADLQRVD